MIDKWLNRTTMVRLKIEDKEIEIEQCGGRLDIRAILQDIKSDGRDRESSLEVSRSYIQNARPRTLRNVIRHMLSARSPE
jgi:hypothetical protein